MKTNDLVHMGLRNLWRRKLRTSLTVVGVVIGTFSIIVMVSLGIGMNENFKKQIMERGSMTTITVDRYFRDEKGDWGNDPKTLDDKLVEKIKKMDHVEAVTPIMQLSGKIVSGKYLAYTNLVGIDPEALSYFDFPEVEEGGKLLDPKVKNSIMFGSGSTWFYNPKKPNQMVNPDKPFVDIMKDKLELTLDWSYGQENNNSEADKDKVPSILHKMKIAGKLVETKTEKDWSTYVNIAALKEYKKAWDKAQGNKANHGGGGVIMFSSMGGNKNKNKNEFSYDNLWIKVDNVKNVDKVQSAIKEMKYGASSLGDQLKPLQETANVLQLILGGIGAISMIVSAIGIANTMIMSIYERTKEIGVMKVLGCLVGDIKKLFLFEATMIGFMGGVFGVILSYLTSFLINTYGGSLFNSFMGGGGGNMGGSMNGGEEAVAATVSVIPLWLVALAMVFAIMVGMLSGYFPAKRATKISALEAMKSEG